MRCNGGPPFAFPPDVTGKEIIIKGSAAKGFRDMEGFIAGQGGLESGYGLYIKDNHLTMVVKQDGKVYTATSAGALPERFDFEGRLADQGAILLFVDGKQVGNGKASSLFTKPLADIVRSQRDFTGENSIGAYTGAYTSAFDFVGNVQNATLEVRKPAADGPRLAGRVANSDRATVLTIKVVEEQMKYDTKVITVKAGLPVVLTLENPDVMQHNLVICKTGTVEKVGKAADALARDPKGLEKNYVPQNARRTGRYETGQPRRSLHPGVCGTHQTRRLPIHLHVSRPLEHHAGNHEGRENERTNNQPLNPIAHEPTFISIADSSRNPLRITCRCAALVVYVLQNQSVQHGKVG